MSKSPKELVLIHSGTVNKPVILKEIRTHGLENSPRGFKFAHLLLFAATTSNALKTENTMQVSEFSSLYGNKYVKVCVKGDLFCIQ